MTCSQEYVREGRVAAKPPSLYRRTRALLKRMLPRALYLPYRYLCSRDDRAAIHEFLSDHSFELGFFRRLSVLHRLYVISHAIHCPHTQRQILSFFRSTLSMPRDIEGCVVEAGAYKGGSTAKFSIAVKLAGRELVVFDSFQGIPENDEPHDRNIFDGEASFPEGSYCGSLDEVKGNVRRYGEIEVCSFVEGWFEDTMPSFSRRVAAIYLDVDLEASTRTCLKYLYPRLAPGGVLYSQDGHLPLVISVFENEEFWTREVGCRRPHVEGLGEEKLIWTRRPADLREGAGSNQVLN